MIRSQPDVSLQTKLLVMTHLGLANAALNWKPFELGARLSRVRVLQLSSGRLGPGTIRGIKSLLSATIIVEFLCSLLLPFECLLKLYPVITWTRSYNLLPWLVTHVFHSILPKVVCMAVVFVFYSARVISTLSLLEFLLVESINLAIASYNWHVFYSFYLHLRKVEKNRRLSRSQTKRIESYDSLPRTFSSIPNIHELLRNSENSLVSKALRHVRSLTYLPENNVESEENSSLADDPNLTPAEKTMKILNLTQEDLEDARKNKSQTDLAEATSATDGSNDSLQRDDYTETDTLTHSDSDSESDSDSYPDSSSYSALPRLICLCSSSSETDAGASALLACETREPNFLGTASNNILKPRRINHSNHRLKSPDSSNLDLVPLRSGFGSTGSVHLRLSADFKLLDLTYQSEDPKGQALQNNTMRKWLIFRRALDSSLDGNAFLKDSLVNALQLEKKVLKDQHTQTEKLKKEQNSLVSRKNHAKFKVTEKDSNFLEIPQQTFTAYHARNSSNYTFLVPSKTSMFCPTAEKFKYRRSNISVLKSIKPTEWPKYIETKKARELRNLKAYNKLTLEQDRREMLHFKKKKSKVPSAKKPVVQIHNSEMVVPNLEKQKRPSSKSNPLREKVEPQNFDLLAVSDFTIPDRETVIWPQHSSLRETIDGLDWSTTSNNFYSPKVQPTRRPLEDPDQDRRVIVDDETLNQLQSAFSFSDESDRGLQLGPELNEPYPIFQVVALTIAEIFKASGWRNLVSSNEVETSRSQDIIFCGNEVDLMQTANDDVDRRRIISSNLLDQLQSLLESSRETLLALRNSRLAAITESRLRLIEFTDEFFTKCATDYIQAFKELTICSENINRELSNLACAQDCDADSTENKSVQMIYENKLNFNPSKNLEEIDLAQPSSSSQAYFDFSEKKEVKLGIENSEDELSDSFDNFYNRLTERLRSGRSIQDKLKALARSKNFLHFISLFDKEDLDFFCKKIIKTCCQQESAVITEIELNNSEFHGDLDETVRKNVVTSTNQEGADQNLPSTSTTSRIYL